MWSPRLTRRNLFVSCFVPLALALGLAYTLAFQSPHDYRRQDVIWRLQLYISDRRYAGGSSLDVKHALDATR